MLNQAKGINCLSEVPPECVIELQQLPHLMSHRIPGPCQIIKPPDLCLMALHPLLCSVMVISVAPPAASISHQPSLILTVQGSRNNKPRRQAAQRQTANRKALQLAGGVLTKALKLLLPWRSSSINGMLNTGVPTWTYGFQIQASLNKSKLTRNHET